MKNLSIPNPIAGVLPDKGAFGVKISGFKNFFFDREAVLTKANAAEVRVLSKFGAYVRRSAKSSIKTKKGASRPGTPPHSHDWYMSDPKKDIKKKSRKRYYFRDSILFAWEPKNRSVIVGPFLFNGQAKKSPTVPELHEFGGTASYGPRGQETSRRFPARPYMRPALDKERPKFAGMFRDSISR